MDANRHSCEGMVEAIKVLSAAEQATTKGVSRSTGSLKNEDKNEANKQELKNNNELWKNKWTTKYSI